MTTVTTATTTKSITATSTTTMMSTSFGAADRPLAVNKAPAPTRALTSYDDVSNEDFPRLRCTNVVYQQQEQEVLWPCLYFPSYNRAYDELKTLTDKDLFPETYLTKLANIFLSHVLDGEDICPDTTPFLLTIGPTMLLIFEPSKETCLSYGRCVKNFIRNRGLVPGLDDAVRTAKKILDCSSSTTTNIGISLPAMATNSKTSNARIVEATKARASTGGRNASATTKPAAKEVSDSVGNHRYDHYVRARQVSPGEDGKQPGKSGMQVAEDSLGAYIRGPLPASPHAKTATTAREEQKTTGVNCATEKKPSASNDPEKPKTPSHDAASKTSDEKNKEEEASATMKEDVVMQDSSDTASEMVAKASEKGAAVQSNKQDNAATTSTTGNAKSVAEANLKESPKNKTKKTAPAATKPQGGKKENMETNQEKKLGSAKKARKDASPSQSQRKKRTFTIAKKDRRIPKLNDVKATLEGLGFTIYEKNGQTYYCLPGKDPASDSFAVEGEHYFTSEEAFRAHLCSRGLGDQLNFDEYCQGYALLQKWIRFSIVKSSCVKKSELPKEFVGSHNVWNLLSLLGLKVRNGIYALKDGTSFVGEREFSVHLSQYGLPGDSDFGNITEDERLQLELRFAEYKRDLLLPNPLIAGERSTRKRSRSSPPSINPKKKSKKARRGKGSALDEKTSKNSPAAFDSKAWSSCNQNPPGRPTTKGLGSRNISAEMEDKRSDSEKLGQCLQKLGDEMECNGRYNGFALGGTESKLRKNISAISAILEEMIQSRVMDSLSSTVNNMKSETAALYVCGVPGTGKSSGIQFCCNRILDRAKNNPTFMQGVEPIVVEINAAHLAACKTGDSLKSKVVNDIWEKCDSSMSKRTENALFKRLSSTRAGKKPGFVILVLDEVDQLMKENETKATNAAEKLLEQLNKWASDPTCRFALICIGNSMNNSKQRRLEEFVKFYRTFIFSAYSKEDIIEILQARIGEEIIEPNALTFIAGKIANTSGDVRDAIGLAKKAIQAAQQKVSDDKEGKCVETNSSGKKDFLVKMRDVVRLNAEVQKCSQLLAGLPTNAKFVATVFVDLIRKYAGSADAMTRRDFEQACIDTSHRNNPDTYVDRATITSGIGLLEDNGIFRVSRRSEIDPGFDEIACEFHAQEVEMAVKEALGADYELLSGFLV